MWTDKDENSILLVRELLIPDTPERMIQLDKRKSFLASDVLCSIVPPIFFFIFIIIFFSKPALPAVQQYLNIFYCIAAPFAEESSLNAGLLANKKLVFNRTLSGQSIFL